MTNEPFRQPGFAYEIEVKDHLEKHWLTYFTGWSIENLDNGVVLLRIQAIDQAGLHGVLNRIRDLNLNLLSVKQLGRERNGNKQF